MQFFFSQLSSLRGHAYHFTVPYAHDDPVIISVKQKVEALGNPRFDPSIYMVRYLPTAQHPINYALQLNEKYPYLLESNIEFEDEGGWRFQSKSNDHIDEPYFIFSSSDNPIDTFPTDSHENRNHIIILSVCIPIGVIASVFLTIIILHEIKNKRRP